MKALPQPLMISGRHQAFKEWPYLIAILLGALALRSWFVLGGWVGAPFISDATQYGNYAWNLVHAHTFSMADPGSESVVPDNYRDPGYPLLLAGLMLLFGSGDAWYHSILLVQVILGALSAGLAFVISRHWLGRNASFFVGMAVAVWPHNMAISDFLLSETLFGFMVLLALWLLVSASGSARRLRWGLAGLGFGAAAMVNATMTPFGLLLAAALCLKRLAPSRLLLAFLIGSLLLPGAWAVRSLTLKSDVSAGNRVTENLVQGSWPIYHSAFKAFPFDAQAAHVMDTIHEDTALANKSLVAWSAKLLERVEREPGKYLAWYAWKPELLWAWNIRVGFGDVYPYPIAHPIFSSSVVMRVFEALCVALDPVLFVLMAVAAGVVLFRSEASKVSIGLYAAALLIAFETLVYSVLQSEPRYSIPFRPLQMMLVAAAIEWAWRRWQAGRRAMRSSPMPAGEQGL